MKNIIKFLGLFSLIGFSFFYTDKVMDVALEQDSIMIEINQIKENYQISPTDAIILENGMIPGINGKEINIEASYNNMRSIGIFHKNYLVFKQIKPKISMYDYYYKSIIQGNSNKHMVSLIFILNDTKYLNKLSEIIQEKNIKINLFVDYNFLNSNSTIIKKLKNCNIYSYGLDGKYTPDTLLFSKNLIERIMKQETNFCLSKENQVIEVCSDNKMFTVVPNIIINNNLYSETKNNINSGSIILIDLNQNNLDTIKLGIDYIKAKGLDIGYLSELLNEELIESQKNT